MLSPLFKPCQLTGRAQTDLTGALVNVAHR